MSEEFVVFFAKEENKKLIEKVIHQIGTVKYEGVGEKLATKLIAAMNASTITPEEWDKHCQITIKEFGLTFIDVMKRFDPANDLEMLFCIFFRFVLEYNLSVNDNPSALDEFVKFVEKEDGSFSPDVLKEINYIRQSYPVRLLKILHSSENIITLNDYIATVNRAEKLKQELKDELDTGIKERQEAVENLKKVLEEQAVGYNFVGLYKGFDDLSKLKETEKKLSFKWLVSLGAVLLIVLCGEAYFLHSQFSAVSADTEKTTINNNNTGTAGAKVAAGPAVTTGAAEKPEPAATTEVVGKSKLPAVASSAVTAANTGSLLSYLQLIPMASIVIILLYYFRIALMDYKSVKSQILQIELRKTLCQFIQKYAEYANDFKSKEFNPLDKFESLIFSGIVADDGRIPATFDGIEQLANLAKALKN